MTLRTFPSLLVLSALPISAMMYGAMGAIAQSTKPPQQPLYLPDPTPRPRDLSRDLSVSNEGTEADRARREQALAVQRRARSQIMAEAEAMTALADQLREHASRPGNLPAPPLDRMAIQKIEQLAKDVRSRLGGQ